MAEKFNLNEERKRTKKLKKGADNIDDIVKRIKAGQKLDKKLQKDIEKALKIILEF